MGKISYDFTGKVVLVTGGGTGIGRAAANEFALNQAWVAVSDSDEDAGYETVKMIQKEGGEALFFKCDPLDSFSVEKLMDDIENKMGGLDCAFNNAEIKNIQSLEQIIALNTHSTRECMRYEIPLLLKRGAGSIVNSISIAGLLESLINPSYSRSHDPVIELTKQAAVENAPFNVRVNAICPGLIDTPFLWSLDKSETDVFQILKSCPMRRLGKVEEMAAAIVWLCADQSSYITGHTLVVDGGFASV